jgi:hypothetical protein
MYQTVMSLSFLEHHHYDCMKDEYLHLKFGVSMVAYLDDWLIYGQAPLPAAVITKEIERLGISINLRKSFLQPTNRLEYLGLDINLRTGPFLQPQADS